MAVVGIAMVVDTVMMLQTMLELVMMMVMMAMDIIIITTTIVTIIFINCKQQYSQFTCKIAIMPNTQTPQQKH